MRTFAFNYIGSFGLGLPYHPIYAESSHSQREHSHHFGMVFSKCPSLKESLIKQMLILYVVCLLFLCHRRIFVYILIIVDFLFIAFSAPLYPKERQMCYFKICLLSTFSSTVICWMAIWLSFWRRSPCGRPSLIKTALRFSMLLRQINWLIVA